MSESVDAFKFVAIRPPRPAAESEDQVGLIHDGRPDAAAREPDPALVEPLARAANTLLDQLSMQPADAPLPDLAMEQAPIGDAAHAALAAAWGGLYAAYRKGPQGGPELQPPMAALRLLHLQRLREEGRVTTVGQALSALTAIPVVPVSMATVASPPEGEYRGTAPVADHTSEAREQARSLLEDVAATRTLLESLRAGAQQKARVLTEEPAADADVRHRKITVGRLATASTVLAGELAPAAQQVAASLRIGDATTIPAATTLAQQHMTSLLQRVNAMRDDPHLTEGFRTLSGTLNLTDVSRVLPDIGIGIGSIVEPDPDPGTSPDVDVSGRIRPLGIGDLKVVKQTLLAYVPGEVAHIENILKGEHKERVYRTLDRLETTYFEATEETTDTERDTQSTDRFELKKEADRTIKEDMSIQAGVNVTAAFGPVVTTAHGDFAYATSKQESTKNSANFAREVVDRSVSKIQKKVTTERTTKTFHEAEETNTHGVDNAQGTGHITGVYRWVDKHYRAQVYNYGCRLMLEFVVPQPAAYWLAAQKKAQPPVNAVPPLPFVNAKGTPLTAADLDESNYQIYAGRYRAEGITPPPPEWAYASTAFEQSNIENGKTISKALKDLVVPDGYTMIYYTAHVSLIYVVGGPRFAIQIGDDAVELVNNVNVKQGSQSELGWATSDDRWDNPRGAVPVSCIGYDINAYSVNIGINCSRDPDTFQDWQNKIFEKISTAYQAMQTAYDQKVSEASAQNAGIAIEGRNPGQNREIMERELKKLCITMMSGSHLSGFNAMTNPADAPTHLPEVNVYEALSQGPIIQFFEQAFDWPQMTYLFYPYFWGRKSQWVEASNRTDPDPMFENFLQAGAARVVVPVPMAYRDAVCYFLSRNSPHLADRVWLGGDTPTIDDPLYKSIADELRAQTDDLAGATPEGAPWEFTMPTTLVWLQQGPDLPVFSA